MQYAQAQWIVYHMIQHFVIRKMKYKHISSGHKPQYSFNSVCMLAIALSNRTLSSCGKD